MDVNMDIDVPMPAIPSESAALRVLRSLFGRIAVDLSLFEVSVLSQLHRDLFNHPAEHLNLFFRTFLSSHFDSPGKFRSRMRDWGVVMSGSSALWFITRDERWEPEDLDLYCPVQHKEALLRYLKEKEGYTAEEQAEGWMENEYETMDPGATSKILSVIKLTKTVGDGEGDDADNRYIDIIVSKTKCGLDPIFDFHSTVVMNYISADEVVSTYPVFTSAHINVVQNDRGGEKMEKALWKYHGRGYALVKSRFHFQKGRACGALCPSIGTRVSGDAYCFRIPIPPEPEYTEPEFIEGAPRHWFDAQWQFEDRLKEIPPCWNSWCPRNSATWDAEGSTPPTIGGDVEEQSPPPSPPLSYLMNGPKYSPLDPILVMESFRRLTSGAILTMELEHKLRSAHFLIEVLPDQALALGRAANDYGFRDYSIHSGQLKGHTIEKSRVLLKQSEKSLLSSQRRYDRSSEKIEAFLKEFQERSYTFRHLGGLGSSFLDDRSALTAKQVAIATAIQTSGPLFQAVILGQSRSIAPDQKALKQLSKMSIRGFQLVKEVLSRQAYAFQLIQEANIAMPLFAEHYGVRCRVRRLEKPKNATRYANQLEEAKALEARLKERVLEVRQKINAVGRMIWREPHELAAPSSGWSEAEYNKKESN